MKKTIGRLLSVALSLVLCVAAASALLAYIRPMEDKSYDLSLISSGEAVPTDWVYDDKGWTVFTQEGDQTTLLSPNGFGGFTGLSQPGQTFYFSREMTEVLDCPILRLGVANRTVSVFLDGELLYTDCPEQDNRIGYLTLPMLEWDRTEQVVVSLPANYVGKTLTIAQSTDVIGEKQEPDSTVWPCSVTLACSYAYESTLIAESYRAALPSAFFFAAGVFLLLLFVWQVFGGKTDIGLVCAAAAAFLWLTYRMARTSYSHTYFSGFPVDAASLCRIFSLTALLGFLSSRLTWRRRRLLWVLTGAQGALGLAYGILQHLGSVSFGFLAVLHDVSLAALLCALVCGFFEWRKGSPYFRLFCPATVAGIVICAGAACLSAPWRAEIRQQLSLGALSYFLWPLLLIMMIVALAAAVVQVIRKEAARRAEARLLAQRQELAQASFETMRRQHEQVMMLRHDMAKHLHLLRQMTGEAPVAAYLDELIGQNETIRPVVQSGNETLDILLNGKLSAAADAGVKIEIVRMQAPEKLPLSDAELCSLLVNILDNAVAAASAPALEQPYIRLDMHIKNGFFVFSCLNSATPEWILGIKNTQTAPEHGLGMKIIRQIAQRHGDLLETEYDSDHFKITLALPLDQPSK
ncbi:MAG: sensor histidine kinase [Oscillospiraceae bacterium]